MLFGGLDASSVHVTRIRAELSRAALGTDLLVGASSDQSDVANFVQTEKFEGTQPACPAPPPGCWYYEDTVDEDGNGNNGSDAGGCTLSNSPSPSKGLSGTAFGGLLLAGVGVALMRRRRRRVSK